ncbi:trimeric intracellular cation channel family protein [Pseudoxanthomonas sp. PXM02]|uniref:trimeric intracellular cation channel family protein n=1 Tax=Pseudoxanthomonas sp. PXM02 TaxID=2769294 RepID=UPI001780721D|nr:trimeric intracellular cation channel family protein [Pseudoxanthomonas sp. PXM02]MBD9480094.1 trimeric intracellular cation channel family protein [Pseudoxanthomonas sp. PXM02]
MDTLVLLLDLVGTFVFALSGATLGVRRRLDIFGVLVLSFIAATAGGITRDLLIGATPPAALSDWRYPVTSLAAGIVTFFWVPLIEKLHHPVRLFDAMGLALFAVAGTQKALEYGISPPMAAGMGMLTGIGGGIARDVLLAQVPLVLRAELYAVAALAGALVVAGGHWMGLPVVPCALVGAALCFGLRMMAVTYGWHLPIALQSGGDGEPPGPLK